MPENKPKHTEQELVRFEAQAQEVAQKFATLFATTRLGLEKRLAGGEDLRTLPDMSKPTNYHERVRIMRNFYDRDPLFAALIDRTVQYATTPTRIRAMSRKELNKTRGEKVGESEGSVPKTVEEQKFWDEWSEGLNMDVDNQLPGIDALKAMTIKNLLLEGMSSEVAEIGVWKVTGEGRTYIAPTKITTIPGAVIALIREIDKKEFIPRELVFVNTGQRVDTNSIPVSKDKLEGTGWVEMKAFREFKAEDFKPSSQASNRQFGFALKYNHSPSDPSTLGQLSAPTGNTGDTFKTHGLYPNPPFSALQGALTVRQQGLASDLAILDAVINQILLVKVGDKDHDVEPDKLDDEGNVVVQGTLAKVGSIMTPEESRLMMHIILPYYMEIEKIVTDTSTLMNAEKFLHATMTVYAAFGISMPPPNVRADFTDTNRTNFEEMLDYLIEYHWTRFLKMLIKRIVQWNGSKLSAEPTVYNLPTNTKKDAFFANLDKLRNRGEISHTTLLQFLDLHPAYETQLLMDELASGRKDILDASVPIQFMQATEEEGEGGTTKTGTGGTKSPGAGTQGKKKTGTSAPTGRRKTGNRVQGRPRK